MSNWTFSSEQEPNTDEELEPITKRFDYDRAFFVGFKIKPKGIHGFIFSIEDSEEIRAVLRNQIATRIVDKENPLVLISEKARDYHEYLIKTQDFE